MKKNKPLGGVQRCAGPGPGLTAGPALCAEKFKVGIVFSMTGGAAAYGASQKEGAQLAIEQINAPPARDRRSKPSSRTMPACRSRASTCSIN